jgi:hypothetical protein
LSSAHGLILDYLSQEFTPMFENPILVFFFVIFAGLWLIDKINDFCSLGDLFNGRAFSFSHYTTHVDREFTGFFYVLIAALGAGAIALIIPCFASDYAPRRVFIQDLVNTKEQAKVNPAHKTVHATSRSKDGSHHKGETGKTLAKHQATKQ